MLPDVGPVRFNLLLKYFGNVESILSASVKELLKVKGIGKKTAETIVEKIYDVPVDKELRKVEKIGAKIITIEDEEYPQNLRTTWAPPPVIYVKGKLIPEDKLSISIVGTRSATSYGKRTAERLAMELARYGLTVVSGLARGIDTYAHWGAIKGNGRTLGVLGCGIDIIYPPENKNLFEKIVHHGALISEFPMGTLPERFNFPRRNRIISGLTLGTLVIEASMRSGALITANYAVEQGREVFAIPGNLENRLNKGSHELIKQGAKLVTCVEDILEEIELLVETLKSGLKSENKHDEKNIPSLSESEQKIYTLITTEPLHIDYITHASGMSSAQVASLLMQLELKGLVNQLAGKMFVKAI